MFQFLHLITVSDLWKRQEITEQRSWDTPHTHTHHEAATVISIELRLETESLVIESFSALLPPLLDRTSPLCSIKELIVQQNIIKGKVQRPN